MEAESGRTEIVVEVAYATPVTQAIVRVEVPTGCTVAQAIELSGIRERFPGMNVQADAVGIFSRKVPLEHVLADGDRVEIYRPLIADPKEARRARAGKPPGRRSRNG
jgi:putative ubiquitin-RnfH superfamily antitoxin RatB of RatAB toxin-antitoxin module